MPNTNDAIKFGSVMITVLAFLLLLSTFNYNIGDPTKMVEMLVIVMLIFSIITAIATFVQKNFR